MIDMYSVAYKTVPYPLPNNWIKTLAVGDLKYENINILRDDSGINIAHLNRYFGELTAQYWVWKNSNSKNHVGFCHYRRYFNFLQYPLISLPKVYIEPNLNTLGIVDSHFQESVASQLLNTYEVLTTRQYVLNESISEQYCNNHPEYTWLIFLQSIEEHSPSWIKNNLDFFNCSNHVHFYLMYIMHRDIFNELMSQMFSVLMPVFEQIGDIADIPGARFQPSRYPAYLAERYMMLYFFSRRTRLYGSQVFAFESDC